MTSGEMTAEAGWLRRHGIERFCPCAGEAPSELRQRYKQYLSALNAKRRGVPVGLNVRDRLISAAGGQDVLVRQYVPATAGTVVLVYIHGGGWTIGDLDSHDHLCRYLAAVAGCVVISVNYRLAPEWPFPHGLHDCVAVVRWAAAEFRGNGWAERLVVAGDSAGANLAVCTAIHEREARYDDIDGQLLIYGAFDVEALGPWWFRDRYLPVQRDRRSPYANPFRATPEGLPPAIVVSAGYDSLKGDSEALHGHLKRGGVDVCSVLYEDMPHGFLDFAGIVPSATDAAGQIARLIRGGAYAR